MSERRPVRSRGWRTTRAIGESLDKAGVRAQGAGSAPVVGVHARCATSPSVKMRSQLESSKVLQKSS